MSRANIVDLAASELAVTFQLRSGELRTYFYAPNDFAAIVAGADPADFPGSPLPLAEAEIIEGIGDIGEFLL